MPHSRTRGGLVWRFDFCTQSKERDGGCGVQEPRMLKWVVLK